MSDCDFEEEIRDLAYDLIQERGRTVLFRKATRIEIPETGEVISSPVSSSDATMLGNYFSGNTIINIQIEDGTGLLVAGDKINLDSLFYTVSGGPYACVSGTIANVNIESGLLTDFADGTSLQIVFSGTDRYIKAAVDNFSLTLINDNDSSIKSGDFKLYVAQKELDENNLSIETDDDFYNGPTTSSKKCAVVNVDKYSSGERDALLLIHARNYSN